MPRVALVTGATRGFGRRIALRLASDGLDVAVNDAPGSAGLAGIAKEINSFGRRSYASFADVSLEDQVERMVRETVDVLGGLDVLVANTDILLVGGMLSTTADELDRVMSVNARGTFLCYKHVAKQMIAQGRGGKIINASPKAAQQGYQHLFAYCASKFAVRGMTQAAAVELEPHGITINSYNPYVKTSADTTGRPSVNSSKHGDNGENNGTAPEGHLAPAEDIAALVSYMASEGSVSVTGMTFNLTSDKS